MLINLYKQSDFIACIELLNSYFYFNFSLKLLFLYVHFITRRSEYLILFGQTRHPATWYFHGCVRKPRQLTWWLVIWGNDFTGSVFAQRHFMKLIADRLLRQCNGLMIYNKIERVLVITKQIFNYFNTDFSLEITSKVQKVSQKYTFTHKLTTKRNF